MPRCHVLVLAFAFAFTFAAVRAIPVDEISARNGIGSRTNGGSLPAAASNMSELSGVSLLKTASENAGNQAGLTGLSTSLGSGSVPGGSGLAGAGGGMPGDLALIELVSDKIGLGGGASNEKTSGLVD